MLIIKSGLIRHNNLVKSLEKRVSIFVAAFNYGLRRFYKFYDPVLRSSLINISKIGTDKLPSADSMAGGTDLFKVAFSGCNILGRSAVARNQEEYNCSDDRV